MAIREATPEEMDQIREANKNGIQHVDPMSKSPLIGKPSPEFSVTDIHGKQYSLEDLKGKIVVLNLWFINCKPCIMEMPKLNRIAEKYKTKEVVFIGVSVMDTKTEILEFLKKTKFEYALVPNEPTLSDKFGTIAFPTNIIIDKNSIITYMTSGYASVYTEQIDAEINRLLLGDSE
jgi:thiol-disulfide isomerase/thioredoxin